MRSPILIFGSPRSGTSLTAGILHGLGVWVGECRPASQWNPKGYFENDAIRDLCWAGGRARTLSVASVSAVLHSQGWNGGPWLYKHAPHRVDHWQNFNPIRVKVWRDPDAIVMSRTARGHTSERAERDIKTHHSLMREMDGIDITPSKLIAGDDSEIRAVAEYCGLDWNPACLDILDKKLWHH